MDIRNRARKPDPVSADRPVFRPVRGRSNTLRLFRAAALIGIAVIITVADVAAFVESFRGLYEYALGHGLTGNWALFWPLQIDAFIIVGELTLFMAITDRFDRRGRVLAWAATIGGTVVSMIGNIGHLPPGVPDLWRATAAVPPVAATAGLMIGLGVLKRVLHVVEHAPVRVTVVRSDKPLNWALNTRPVGLVGSPRSTPGSATASLTHVKKGHSAELPPARTNGFVSPAPARPETNGVVAPKRSGRTNGDPRENPRYAEGLKRVHDLVMNGGAIPTGRWLASELNYANRVIPNLVIADYKNGVRPT